MIFYYFNIELFQLGESFVSNTWSLDQLPGEEEEQNKENTGKGKTSKDRHEATSSDNTCTSEDDDASSSVTITSPRISEHPPAQITESNRPPIGKRHKPT